MSRRSRISLSAVAIGALGVGAVVALFADARLSHPRRAGPPDPDAERTRSLPPSAQSANPSESYADGARGLSDLERAGRDTWYFWTGGNEKFWRTVAARTNGEVDFLLYLDARRHDRRFETLGVINDPGCHAPGAADRYGFWMDECADAGDRPATSPGATPMPGAATGVVGLRRFDNPAFNAAAWSLERYLADWRGVEPPYLIGMTCGFCHVGFNPVHPPSDVDHPTWADLAPTIGNQYFEEGRLFTMRMTPADFRWHLANRQPPGTSDTSRFATDHIDNPSSINALFNLAHRPQFPERMPDGSTRLVNHILKDGADSIGLAGAALRVYANIGMCGDYAATRHDPIAGVARGQQPFDLEQARVTCGDFRATDARIGAVAAFLSTPAPLRLADAPGGAAYLSTDGALLERGKRAFADRCAACHSSKRPPAGTANVAAWYRESVLASDFLADNFLSDDSRYAVTRIGTNIGRAMASNATRGHIWDQFSSETYKALPSAGTLAGLYNPRNPGRPLSFPLPAGGRGYYRPPSLASLWATAPYLHNNSVGLFVRDPSVASRMAAFRDGMQKMLWPERRLGVQSIPVTSTDSTVAIPGTTRSIRVPMGTPIDYIARVDPTGLATLTANVPAINLLLRLTPDDRILDALLSRNLAPDFILDHGHPFGSDLSDDDKWALIEFLKRL